LEMDLLFPPPLGADPEAFGTSSWVSGWLGERSRWSDAFPDQVEQRTEWPAHLQSLAAVTGCPTCRLASPSAR